MADTSLKIDEETRDLLRKQAEAEGLSMKEYLAHLARRVETERGLESATRAFARFTADTDLMAQFDAEYGGLAAASGTTTRAA